MPNTYQTSSGKRFTQPQIEAKIRKAKAIVLQNQLDTMGYNVCVACLRNDCKPIDCSHTISVKEAKETGRTELCWDIENIVPLGRGCHQRHDKLDLKFNEL